MDESTIKKELLKALEEKSKDTIIKKILNMYKLNEKNLKKFIEIYGIKSILYLEYQPIKDAINLDEKTFEKYIELFNQTPLTLEKIKNILYPLEATKFYIEQQLLTELFQHIKTHIENQIEISEFIIKEIENLTKENLQEIIIKAKEDFSAFEQIHEIIRKYIKIKMNNYITKKQHTLEDLIYELKYDEAIKNKKILEIIVRDYNDYLLKEEIVEKIKEDTDIDKEIIRKCIQFMISSNKDNNNKITNKLKYVRKSLLKLIEQGYFKCIIEKINKKELELIKQPTISDNPLPILSCLDINLLKTKGVLSDTKIYEKFLILMRKYNFIRWSNTFSSIGRDIDIPCDEYSIAVFINTFHEIEKKITPQTSLIEILKISKSNSAIADIYTYILGKETARIIRENPKPYSGVAKPRTRLDTALKYTIKLLKRKYITIPTIHETVDINNKKILINLGEITDPINLSSGEKMKLCTRILGIGEKLYNFCLFNENGGILKFINPKTNQLINKISVVRNGNTVFMNLLVDSIDKSYNEEIIEATIIAAKLIVEKSKNSTYPIDNVIISNAGLFEGYKNMITGFNYKTFYEGYERLNNDIGPNVHLLASSDPEHKLKPVNTNKENIPLYPLLENIFLTNEEQIIRLKAINEYLKGTTNINIVQEQIIYSIVGKFWYVYINKENQIISFIMDDNEKTILEYQDAIKKASEKLGEINKKYNK